MGTNYVVSDKATLYLNYALENETGISLDGTGMDGQRGSLVGGMKRRLSDSSSVYVEERQQDTERMQGLTHAAGMPSNPSVKVEDGHGVLGVSEMHFDEKGVLQFVYSQTEKRSGPQIALALIPNESSLEIIEGRAWAMGRRSEPASVL